MDISIFPNKEKIPDEKLLESALEGTYQLWQQITDYIHQKYPESFDEWNYPGAKYGWSFRMKDKKRAIIYLLPRERYFKVALIFGQKAFNAIMQSNVSTAIKTELESARVYAEGRGIRIDVVNHLIINDIKELIDIKLLY